MAHYAWKGLQGDKYATGRVEAINREEAAFKVKQIRDGQLEIPN